MATDTAQLNGDPRRALGQYGERLAARYLRDCGLSILDRNWRCAHGEIDLVARDADCLVFCEVKTRRSERFGAPVEAVDRRKAARLRRLAAAWLQEHEVRPGRIRIDVIGILRPPQGPAVVRHLVGVGP
ncbi:YraN family protein [Pedococcus sp. 5OH_020]|jgi:putative endonuclease|uniref:YraN family protein n=1 Tax=Pedococcus sp. 5OH_020 TaxID=2989814 RepID=UPI0022E9A6FF|nr:YraN family protein [Pedococcus sp. 5OH_020]